MMDRPRVRFAPSPTGFLHVGGARTALFNWLFARHEDGVFVLRIEDTDRERTQEQLTQAILDGLAWLGIAWDEGPYHQADGLKRHRADVRRLVDSGAAYRCFCKPEQLEAMRAAAKELGRAAAYDGRCRDLNPDDAGRRAAGGEPHAIRFRMPDGETAWDDVVSGTTRFRNRDIDDFVILRSDSTPTYNLAVVSDDIGMGITHVIRGADHISNTPKQIQIYRALGAEMPVFCHVPLILGPDGKRLSKRHGATALAEYRKSGLLPQAMDNFLALLGWSPGDDQEFMSLDELIDRFSLERINRKPAIFDHGKLESLNLQHMSNTSGSELAELIGPLLIERGIASHEQIENRRAWFEQVLDLVKPRARTIHHALQQTRPFFAGEIQPDERAAAKHWKDRAATVEQLERLRSELAELEGWEEGELELQLRAIAELMGMGAGKLIHPLRVALTGLAVSPGIFEVMDLMGRELVMSRIDDALARLRDG
ncbi:MAG: glutamate--tRNA ligase [Gemmatimonadota bacterium]|nr:MAG: glutamate--tRNA ligase [Gemmatimonadota bacterium]